jgi:hypothetical protein
MQLKNGVLQTGGIVVRTKTHHFVTIKSLTETRKLVTQKPAPCKVKIIKAPLKKTIKIRQVTQQTPTQQQQIRQFHY